MGKYTNADGSTVSFTDGDVIRDVADLYALLEEDYNETPSAISVQLKGMLAQLQSGAPLTGSQWSELASIEQQFGSRLAAWRAWRRRGRPPSAWRLSSPPGGTGP